MQVVAKFDELAAGVPTWAETPRNDGLNMVSCRADAFDDQTHITSCCKPEGEDSNP